MDCVCDCDGACEAALELELETAADDGSIVKAARLEPRELNTEPNRLRLSRSPFASEANSSSVSSSPTFSGMGAAEASAEKVAFDSASRDCLDSMVSTPRIKSHKRTQQTKTLKSLPEEVPLLVGRLRLIFGAILTFAAGAKKNPFHKRNGHASSTTPIVPRVGSTLILASVGQTRQAQFRGEQMSEQ